MRPYVVFSLQKSQGMKKCKNKEDSPSLHHPRVFTFYTKYPRYFLKDFFYEFRNPRISDTTNYKEDIIRSRDFGDNS